MTDNAVRQKRTLTISRRALKLSTSTGLVARTEEQEHLISHILTAALDTNNKDGNALNYVQQHLFWGVFVSANGTRFNLKLALAALF